MAVEPTDAGLPAAPTARGFWLVAIVWSIILAAVVAWVEYLPTNDGPQHIFAAYLQSHLDEAGRGWNRYLAPGSAVTGVGIVPLLGLLDRVLPWQAAFRVVLAAVTLVWAWSVLLLATSLGPRRRWLGLLGFASALNWQLYMGLFSCYLSTALGFLALALVFRFGFARLRVLLMLAVLLAYQATMHVVPAAMTGLVLMLYTALAAPPGTRPRRLAGMLLAGLPAVLVGLTAMLTMGDDGFLSRYATSLPLWQRLALLGRAFVSGPAWRAWPVTLLAMAGLALAWRRPREGERDPRRVALALAGAAFLVLAIALPLHIRGWEFFSVRFVPYAVLFLALLVPVGLPGRPWLSQAMAPALALFSLAVMAWSLDHHRLLHRAHADFLAGIRAPLQRTGPRLPLFVEPPPGEAPEDWDRVVPYVTTNLHVGPLFALTQGGVPAYLFAGVGGIHTLSYRTPPDGVAMPPRPARGLEWGLWQPAARNAPAMRERALAHMLGFAPAYEDVIFWGSQADHQVLRQRGFHPDFAQGGLLIAHFVGCPTRLRLEPPAEGLPPTLVLAGWWPDARPTFSTTLPARPTNDPVEIAIAGSPCGPIWVRVLFDMDRDGRQSPGDRTCRGADAHAVLRHEAARGDVVLCTAAQPVP